MADDTGNPTESATEKQIRLQKLLVELKDKAATATGEELQNVLATQAAIEKQLADMQLSVDLQKRQVEEAEKLLAKYKETSTTSQGHLTMLHQQVEVTTRQIQMVESLARQGQLGADEAAKKREELEKQLIIQQRQVKEASRFTFGIREQVSAAQDLGKSMSAGLNVFGSQATNTMIKFGKAIAGGTLSLSEFGRELAIGALASVLNNMIGLTVQLVNQEAAFRKATGASQQFARGMTEVYQETRIAGVTAQEANEAYQALFTTFTDFTMVSEAARIELGQTAAVLGELGVANQDFAKGVQISTKALGMSTSMAEETQRELTTFAKEIGVAPQQMAADFANAGNMMAKMGDDGVRAFKDLARVSKITGLEVQKLLNITDKFDTFEGAATQAGKLNAALGGNFVNAMDLMMETDPVGRFEQIRGALDSAGLEFDTMGYYQKKFFAESMGLADVNELALVMSGNMDLLAGSTQKSAEELVELKENAAAVQTLGEQFNAVIAAMTPILTPVMNFLKGFFNALSENQGLAMTFVGGLSLAGAWLLVLSLRSKMAMVQMAKTTKALAVESGARIFNAGTMKMQEEMQDDLNDAQRTGTTRMSNMGATAGRSAAGLVAFGAGILLIGAGIGLAAAGLALLALSFGEIGDNAWPAAFGIVGFTIAFALMVVGLAKLAASGIGPVAALLMFAIGTAALMIGGGMAMAAWAVGQFVTAASALTQSTVTLFGDFLGDIAAFIPVVVPAAGALTGLGIALSFLAVSLATLSEEKLRNFRWMLSNLVDLSAVQDLSAVTKEIKAIANAIDGIDPQKSVTFAATTRAVADVAYAGGAVAATNRAALANTAAPTQTQAALPPVERVERPVQIKLDKDVLSDFVVETVGREVRRLNITQ